MNLKKLLALLLALVMIVSMAACGGNGSDETTTETTEETTEGEYKWEFPLESSASFTIIMANDEDWDEDIAINRMWRELQSKTNVRINIKRISRSEYNTELTELLMNGEYWDAIFTSFLTDEEFATLAQQDYFMDVEKYITDERICPNFVTRSMAGREDTILKSMTAPGGGIYGLAGGDQDAGIYLESPILLNKAWVEAAGKKVEDIKTLADIEFLLDYWKKNDMNKNGKKDEIPYLLCESDPQRNMEAFLGLYGIATKDSANDNYVTIKDGKLEFAPMTAGWKAAVKKLSDWYSKGYIWADAFKAANADNVLASTTPVVGMMTAATCGNAALSDAYVAIAPVKVDGYETGWYLHPGLNNPKISVSISKNCKEPEILLAWLDLFLNLENSVRYLYGEQTDQWEYTDDGKYEFLKLTQGEFDKLQEETPSLQWITRNGVVLPTCFTAEDYESKILLTKDQEFKLASYKLYESKFAKEIWPRPYLTMDQKKAIDSVRGDIMKLVTLKRSQWVTGVADIDGQYDQFVKDLQTMGVDTMLKNMQAAYDNYMGK